jgi:hypothetical protein
MRLSPLVLCAAVLLLASDASAQLYEGRGGCSKGMLWPFVRSPGDCLTDAEIRGGMTGTYQRPAGTPTAEEGQAAPAASAPAAAAPTTNASGTAAPPPTAGAPPAPQPPAANAAAPPAAAAPVPGSAPAGQAVAAAQAPVAAEPEDRGGYVGRGGCSKGFLWPFVRKAGDCLTDAEIRGGMTGTNQP